MAGLTDHLRLSCLIDGVLQIEATEYSINGDSGANAVETFAGLSGKTPGARKLEIDAKWALPVSGLEFDVMSACANGTYHELQMPLGNKTLVSKGWWQTATVSGSVNSNTEVQAKFMGTFESLA